MLPLDPRPVRWLVLDAASGGAVQPGAAVAWAGEVARALASRGLGVAWASSRAGGATAAGGGVEPVAWELEDLRRWHHGRDERLRVLALGRDDGTGELAARVDLARELGARVAVVVAGEGDALGRPAGDALGRPAGEAVERPAGDALVVLGGEGRTSLPRVGRMVSVLPGAVREASAETRPDAARGYPAEASSGGEAAADGLVELLDRPTVSVIVLCFNNRDVIEPCVESLVSCRGELGYEVIVVDNGSTDGSREWLRIRARRGDFVALENARNGCSSGRNLGIRAATGEIVVFLDSDQKALRPGWLDPALDILRNHRSVGAVSWNAGWFRPGTGGGTIVDDLPARGMHGPHAGALFRADVAFLATSGMAVPRAVLARTTLFDEFYDPTCFEDTDLSFQVKQAGYEIVYCPYLAIDHRPHATTGALGDYSELYSRNERYFLDKWKHRPEWFFDVP